MSRAIQLSAQLSKDSLPESQAETLVYALVKVEPAAPAEAGMPLNAVVLVERTRAMDQEGRLLAVQQGLRPLVDTLGPQDTLSIVVVSDRPKLLLPAEPTLDKEKAKRLLAFLDSQPGGDPPALADALKLGVDELRKHFSHAAANHVVVVSASAGPQDAEAERQSRLLAEEGIGFSAFGLGPHWPGPPLTHMVDAGRGRLHHLPRPAEFAKAAREELERLQRLPFTNLKLLLRLAKGVKLRRLFQVSPTISHWLPAQPTERDAVVRLGELGDEPCHVLAELVVPPMGAGTYRLATLDLAYDMVVPTHQAGRAGAVDLVANVGAPGAASREVMRYVESVSTFSLVERAIEARRQREIPKAVELLKNAYRIALQAGEVRLTEPLAKAIETMILTQTLPEALSKGLYFAARAVEAEA